MSPSRLLKKAFVHGTSPNPRVNRPESEREHCSLFQQPARLGQRRCSPSSISGNNLTIGCAGLLDFLGDGNRVPSILREPKFSGGLSAREAVMHTVISEDRDPLRPLLAPVTTKTFLNKSFDKSALYIPGQTNKFEGLIALDEFEDILRRGLPWKLRRPPELYLDGGRIPSEDLQLSYIDMDGHKAIRPRLGRVAALKKAGATVACYGMQVIVPSLTIWSTGSARSLRRRLKRI